MRLTRDHCIQIYIGYLTFSLLKKGPPLKLEYAEDIPSPNILLTRDYCTLLVVKLTSKDSISKQSNQCRDLEP